MNWTTSEIAAGLALIAIDAAIAVALCLALATKFGILVWN